MEKMQSPPPYPHPQPPPSMPLPPQPVHIIASMAFGKESQHMICPHCHANISTRVDSEPNAKTHLIALVFCFLGLWCCIPCLYCTDNCLVQKHYCPACSSFLGASQN